MTKVEFNDGIDFFTYIVREVCFPEWCVTSSIVWVA